MSGSKFIDYAFWYTKSGRYLTRKEILEHAKQYDGVDMIKLMEARGETFDEQTFVYACDWKT